MIAERLGPEAQCIKVSFLSHYPGHKRIPIYLLGHTPYPFTPLKGSSNEDHQTHYWPVTSFVLFVSSVPQSSARCQGCNLDEN